MKKKWHLLLILLLITSITVSAVQWEFSLGGSFNVPSLNNTYNPVYSPVLEYLSGAVTEASQELNLKGKNSGGLFLAVNHLFNPNFGIQAAAGFHKTSLKGSGNSYHVHLEYTAFYPPDYTPTAGTFDRNIALPNTDGHINQLTLALNLLARFDIGSQLHVDLSGGVSYFRFKGEASTLGYSFYWEGGHSVMFSEFYQLSFTIEPASKIGVNIGGVLNVKLSNMISLFLDCRYFYCSDVSADVNLKEILNPGDIIVMKTLAEITTEMNLPQIQINPSFLSLASGIKLTF